jgi:hypothetical protein
MTPSEDRFQQPDEFACGRTALSDSEEIKKRNYRHIGWQIAATLCHDNGLPQANINSAQLRKRNFAKSF